MTKNKIIIFICTIVLLIGTILICLYQLADYDNLPIAISITSGDEIETIYCWNNNKGENFVFIPGYVEMSEVLIELNTDSQVLLNGLPLSDGMNCGALEFDVQYECTYSVLGKSYQQNITFVRSGGVGTMYINTDSGNMDYIHAKKGNEESGTIHLYSCNGTPDYIGELTSINGRGNSTWQYFDKKSYSLTLTDEADLLKLGKAQRWILLSNASDASNLRNKLVYEFADLVEMPYSPDSQWLDLYLNGEYAGLYLLAERNEVHPERLNISDQGSFLVSMETRERLETQNYSYVTTYSAQTFRIHHPSDPSDAVLQTIADTWQTVENAIIEDDGVDPVTKKSWQELIDLDSWAKFFLIEEIFGNIDACFTSQYFYYNGDSNKIYAGPVWDYDLSMGCDFSWQLADPQIFWANRLEVRDGHDAPLFYSLYQKDDFYNRVVELYQTEFLPILQKLFSDVLSEYSKQITPAAAVNEIRWLEDTDEFSVQLNYIVNYMDERIAFLNDIWIDRTPYYVVQADPGFGTHYAHYVVCESEYLKSLPILEDTKDSTFLGWYYADTHEPFDITRPITEDIEIYAKWEDSLSNKIDNIIKLIPLGIIVVMFIALFVVDVIRMKREKVTKDGRT